MAILSLLPIGTRAQETIIKDTLKVSLFFKTSITVPTVESRENAEKVMSVISGSADIDKIIIEGWASPEGTETMNIRLAERRAAAAEGFLREYFVLPNNVISGGNTDWKSISQYSRKVLSEDDYKAVEKMLHLPVYDRKDALGKFHGGGFWKQMSEELFPSQRRADITVIFYRRGNTPQASVAPVGHPVSVAPAPSQKDTVVIFHKDTVYYLPINKRMDPLRVQALYPKLNEKLRRPIVAFRSNLLLPLLNVGVEVPIGNRWSASADIYYPWCPREWMNNWTVPQMNCIQGLGGYLEGRYWFGVQHRNSESAYGKYRLLGHSLGLIGGAAYYDVERNGKGQQGEIFTLGIGYTYALPVGKKGGIHLEFEVAAGVVYRIWHPYNVHEEGGYLLRGKDENGIGILSTSKWSFYPIKAGVSLVVPIFSDKSATTKKTGRK